MLYIILQTSLFLFLITKIIKKTNRPPQFSYAFTFTWMFLMLRIQVDSELLVLNSFFCFVWC